MGKKVAHKVNWDDVQESRTIIKPQLVRAKILKAVEQTTRAAQKYMPVLTFGILKGSRDGTKIKNLTLNGYYTLGTDDDPSFTDPDTRGPGLGDLKKVIKKSGARMVGDIAKQLPLLVGKEIGLDVTEEVDDGSKDKKYKGKRRNSIVDYFAIGERSLEASDEDEEEETDEEDEDESEEDEDEEEEDDEDEDDDE